MKKYEESGDLIFFIEYIDWFGCCRHDFIDTMQSLAGYGDTRQEAYEDLMKVEAE